MIEDAEITILANLGNWVSQGPAGTFFGTTPQEVLDKYLAAKKSNNESIRRPSDEDLKRVEKEYWRIHNSFLLRSVYKIKYRLIDWYWQLKWT